MYICIPDPAGLWGMYMYMCIRAYIYICVPDPAGHWGMYMYMCICIRAYMYICIPDPAGLWGMYMYMCDYMAGLHRRLRVHGVVQGLRLVAGLRLRLRGGATNYMARLHRRR